MQSNLDAAEDKAVASVGHAGELRVSLEVEQELARKLQAQVRVCAPASLCVFLQPSLRCWEQAVDEHQEYASP